MQQVGSIATGFAIHVLAIDRQDLIAGMQSGTRSRAFRMNKFDNRVATSANHTNADANIAVTTVARIFCAYRTFITAVTVQIADRTADQGRLDVFGVRVAQFGRMCPVSCQSG